jgi:hypothetical protein
MNRTELDSKLSEVWRTNGAFFAFTKEQYEEEAIENTEYTSCLGGLLCPSENVKTMYEQMNAAIEKFRKEDLAANGKKAIIWRELSNHEAQISNDITSTVEALQGYGITEEDVKVEWKGYFQNCIDNDFF